MDISGLLRAIESKKGAQVLMHPYGFLQLSLSDAEWRGSGYRLHVWSYELPPMKRPEFKVHDHVYTVKSRVLLGELKDTRYEVAENPIGGHLLFKADQGKIANTGIRVSCEETGSICISAGEEYIVQKGEFHSSDSTAPLTATLFQKVDAELDRSPRVIGPCTYEKTELLPDNREFDQRIAWGIIQKVVEIARTYRAG